MPRRNGIGESEDLGWAPLLFPRGAVTPQATFWPCRPVRWTPDQIALHIFAYTAGLTGRYRPPMYLNCGKRKIGLFGSFHASQNRTDGNASPFSLGRKL